MDYLTPVEISLLQYALSVYETELGFDGKFCELHEKLERLKKQLMEHANDA